MEAVILNVAMEILRSTDNHVGPSVLLGLASRLAMHSGYHRDSKHYREISVFDGEMRRRVWMSLRLLDHYISLQAGLPPSTTQVQTDTEEPRNLLDEDLDPSMTTLPPSRPSTEITPMLFPVTLNRMMFMGAEIMSKVCSVKGVPYKEVLQLDAKLKELYAMIPLPLRYRTMSESIADSPNTIMDRYNIDLIYQKCRCDLHRRYLAQHRMDPAFAYSRKECLDAARAVLQHQSDIFESSSVSSFFFSPIVATHFRSAAMIVSLEISCQSRYDLKQNLSPNDRLGIINERHQLSQEIERAFNIWNQLRQQSKEASKMAQALSIMLKVTNTHLQHGDTPEQVGLLGTHPEFQDGESFTISKLILEPRSTHHPLLVPPIPQAPPVILTPQSQESRLYGQNEYSPLDVDLMDASFYLGQDEDPTSQPHNGFFAGSSGIVDFYDRYWDNLMLLGDEQPLIDMQEGGSNQPGPEGSSF